MFTEKQYEIADKILATVEQNAGRCNVDQFYNGLPGYDNHTMDYEHMKETLMKWYHAIEYMGKDKYWLILTNGGKSIATIGLEKHLQRSADKEELGDKKLKLDVANGWVSSFKFAWWVLAAITGTVVDSLAGNPIGSLIRRLIE